MENEHNQSKEFESRSGSEFHTDVLFEGNGENIDWPALTEEFLNDIKPLQFENPECRICKGEGKVNMAEYGECFIPCPFCGGSGYGFPKLSSNVKVVDCEPER